MAPAYQPRSSPSSAGISGTAAACGSPPTAGVGCSIPASSTALTGSRSCARIGVARCWMLATRASTGSSGAVTQTLSGRSRRTMRRVDLHLTGEHDLLEGTRADLLDGAGDGVLVVLGRHRSGDAHAFDGMRV